MVLPQILSIVGLFNVSINQSWLLFQLLKHLLRKSRGLTRWDFHVYLIRQGAYWTVEFSVSGAALMLIHWLSLFWIFSKTKFRRMLRLVLESWCIYLILRIEKCVLLSWKFGLNLWHGWFLLMSVGLLDETSRRLQFLNEFRLHLFLLRLRQSVSHILLIFKHIWDLSLANIFLLLLLRIHWTEVRHFGSLTDSQSLLAVDWTMLIVCKLHFFHFASYLFRSSVAFRPICFISAHVKSVCSLWIHAFYMALAFIQSKKTHLRRLIALISSFACHFIRVFVKICSCMPFFIGLQRALSFLRFPSLILLLITR